METPDSFFALTEQVIGAAFEVSNTLGPGFLERVYKRALQTELRLRGIAVRTEVRFRVTYKGHVIGDYFADLLIDERLVVELKCAESLSDEHTAQCINYLKASGLSLCLLINFQRAKIEWRRVADNFREAA